jgi:hypothetical protein
MEMERPDAAVVPADEARSAGLGDKQQPRAPAPFQDTLLAAALAAVVAATLQDKFRGAVSPANTSRELRKILCHDTNTSSCSGRNLWTELGLVGCSGEAVGAA